MYRSDARRTLGLPPSYTKDDVETAFRRVARLAHPDAGGDPVAFMAIVESRQVLLETLRVHDQVVVLAPKRGWRQVLGRVRRPLPAPPRRVV